MTLEQIRIFSIFFVLGIIISILFEFFRVLRKNIKTGYLATSIEDTLYILISGFLFFKSILVFANGIIRFYIFFAFFLGIIIYILTIKNFCDIIFTVIIKTILIIFKYISLPIKLCFVLLKKAIKKLMKFFNNRRIVNEKHP